MTFGELLIKFLQEHGVSLVDATPNKMLHFINKKGFLIERIDEKELNRRLKEC